MTAKPDAWFAIVPEYVAYCGNPRAVQVFAIMHRHAGDSEEAWPSWGRMAELAGCSPNTVDRALRDLETLGAVSVTTRLRPDGSQTSNLYTLHMTPSVGGRVPIDGEGGSVMGGEAPYPLMGTHESEPLNQSQIEPYETQDTNGRDLIFEAVCLVCGIDWKTGIPKLQRDILNKMVKQLRRIDATPEQVVQKGIAYRTAYDKPLTPQALVRNWAGVDAAAMSDEERVKALRAMAILEPTTGRNLPA